MGMVLWCAGAQAVVLNDFEDVTIPATQWAFSNATKGNLGLSLNTADPHTSDQCLAIEVLKEDDNNNWWANIGTEPDRTVWNSSLDASGATHLSFWAKGPVDGTWDIKLIGESAGSKHGSYAPFWVTSEWTNVVIPLSDFIVVPWGGWNPLDISDIWYFRIDGYGATVGEILLLDDVELVTLPLQPTTDRTYYVDAHNGNDANDGLSLATAFKTLDRANTLILHEGDSILLASGQTFYGALKIQNASGTAAKPIVVTTTGRKKALIDGRGYSAALSILSSSFVEVTNLELTADGGGAFSDRNYDLKIRSGLYVYTPVAGDYTDLLFEGLYIHDVYYEDAGYVRPYEVTLRPVAYPNERYGWGARLRCAVGSTLKNVTFINCTIERVSFNGIRFLYDDITDTSPAIENVSVLNCQIIDSGGPGISVLKGDNTIVRGCTVLRAGSGIDSRHRQKGTGMFFFNNQNLLVERNAVFSSRGSVDCAGMHIDALCTDAIMQYNLLVDNEGGFAQLLGGVSNSAYRYNVSVNDGFRRTELWADAREDGYIFNLWGYVLPGWERRGPDNVYVYNNTIYVSDECDARIVIEKTTNGALFANNIVFTEQSFFYSPGTGNHYTRCIVDNAQENNLVFFQNNLFRTHFFGMDDDPFTYTNNVYANPEFANAGGQTAKDYIPENIEACLMGTTIERLPGDETGLVGGFIPPYDILGNEIDPSRPFIGAIRPD